MIRFHGARAKHKNIAFVAIKFQLFVYVSEKRKIPNLKADRRQLNLFYTKKLLIYEAFT